MHPMFEKVTRGETDNGKGNYWTLTEQGLNTPSPATKIRTKYMMEISKSPKHQIPLPNFRGRRKGSTQMLSSLDMSPALGGENSLEYSTPAPEPSDTMVTTTVELPPHTSSAAEGNSEMDEPDGNDQLPPFATIKQHSNGNSFNEKDVEDEEAPHIKNNQHPIAGIEQAENESEIEGEGEKSNTMDSPTAQVAMEQQDEMDQSGNDPESELEQIHQQQQHRLENDPNIPDYFRNEKVRPPFSYSFLVSQAIMNHPQQKPTLSDIIEWIMRTYPYFRVKENSWPVMNP